ncbi:hypothetical protein [Sinomonas sp. B1-1]|uniref:hypothetical protein n=1 Tax=Sinomonas sp. B1-1 TaxID=3141454 RepID=UPI003D27AB69
MAARPAFRVHRLAAAAAAGLLAVGGLSSAVPVSPALPSGTASGAVRVDQQEGRRGTGVESVLTAAESPDLRADQEAAAAQHQAEAQHRAEAQAEAQRQAEAQQQADAQQAQPAPEAQPMPAPQPAAVFIPVVGAGGQAAVDACAGPVRFTPVTVSVSIAEHDLCGGWDRMGWIQPDTVVSVQGYGTFTAVQRMVVPQGAKEGVLGGFLGGYPPIFLQTCIPGTSEMLLIALR